MDKSIFIETEFFVLVAVSLLLPAGIFGYMMLKRAISRQTVFRFGVLLVALSGVSVFLLKRLEIIARNSTSLLDDRFFSSELSIALYLLPALFAGIGINTISHILISHLTSAEKSFDHKDELTGLPNRRAFFAATGPKWRRHRQLERPFPLLVVDIHNFKKFNAERGHDAGNRVLQALAWSASRALGDVDTVYRLGGDDFVVIPAGAEPQDGRPVALRLQQALAVTMQDKGWNLDVRVCAVSCSDYASSLEDILHRAGDALHTKAKEELGPGVVVELDF